MSMGFGPCDSRKSRLLELRVRGAGFRGFREFRD